jgi:SRSO17 transposase
MEWLLVEWPQDEPEPTKYWLAQLGAQPLGLRRLVRTAKARWRIEQDYRELKEELGLDYYEGRQWLGWHHHVCLVTIAYAFLRAEQARLKKNSGATWRLPQVRKHLLALLIRLSGRCAWCLTSSVIPPRTQPSITMWGVI